MNIYILYINKIEFGDVEPLGRYSSYTEASEHINDVLEKFFPDMKETARIDKNCTVENATKTASWNSTHIIKTVLPIRTEIYKLEVTRGYNFKSYRNPKLEAVISILEIANILTPAPIPPPPPPITLIPSKPSIITKKSETEIKHTAELQNAIAARQSRLATCQEKTHKIIKNKRLSQFDRDELDKIIHDFSSAFTDGF